MYIKLIVKDNFIMELRLGCNDPDDSYEENRTEAVETY